MNMLYEPPISQIKVQPNQDLAAHLSHQVLSCAAKVQVITDVLREVEATSEPIPPEVMQTLPMVVRHLRRLGLNALSMDQDAELDRPFSPEPVHLIHLLNQLIAPFELIAPNRISTYYCTDRSPFVLAEATLLEIVLDNLIENALTYSEPESPVTITLEEYKGLPEAYGSRLIITVTNTGSYIAPEDQEKIFTKFYRGHQNNHSGQGLGLYISRQLVERLGGQLEVESSPVEGTTFWFTLPLLR